MLKNFLSTIYGKVNAVKTLFVVLVALALSSQVVKAQVSTANYTFSTNATSSLGLDMNSNAIDMTSGTTSLVSSSSDDTQSSLTANNLGSGLTFNFTLMGVTYTTFGVTDNGVIGLGVLPATSLYTLPSSTNPIIAPFGNDMRVGTDGSVRAKVVGTAPNRTLVI